MSCSSAFVDCDFMGAKLRLAAGVSPVEPANGQQFGESAFVSKT
jgi:hypothetical protein